jgi:YHS domain-containing protein
MKKKKVTDSKQVKKPKKKWDAILINTFAIVLFGGAFMWMGIIVYNETTGEKKMKDSYLASLPDVNDTIAHSKVCMVDDIFQGDFPSVPVSINNKTYYGCSQKANRDLSTIDSLRSAIDPISKARVDKATAIIGIHPDKDGKVIYFGSKLTFDKYIGVVKNRKQKSE